MSQSIIIGIHGLNNKPSKSYLEKGWSDAITEGLLRNHNMSVRPPFELAYWADIRNLTPIPEEELGEKYEKAQEQGPLERYDPGIVDKARAIGQKWGGKLLDKQKQLFNFGVIEKLLGVKFDDLKDYYDTEDVRKQMRSRLSALLELHQDKRIMLIAHSMGSIIAYDVLRMYDGSETFKIEHFITIGSPLGLPVVAEKVREEFRTKGIPAKVHRWTNIADPGDKVALDCNLVDDYEPNNGVQVVDVLVYNKYVNDKGEANNHKSYGYLRAPELSDYIRDVLSS